MSSDAASLAESVGRSSAVAALAGALFSQLRGEVDGFAPLDVRAAVREAASALPVPAGEGTAVAVASSRRRPRPAAPSATALQAAKLAGQNLLSPAAKRVGRSISSPSSRPRTASAHGAAADAAAPVALQKELLHGRGKLRHVDAQAADEHALAKERARRDNTGSLQGHLRRHMHSKFEKHRAAPGAAADGSAGDDTTDNFTWGES
jgi:hypothetical protein